MRLVVAGVNHRTAPVELREALDFRQGGLDAALAALGRHELVRESVIVSTCNRVEIYAAVESDTVADACARFLAEYHGVGWEALAPHLFILRGVDAARHLFRVAAGLDSLVVGEPQILGQVKDAFAASERAKRTGALIGRAFTTAFTAGKRVRSETGLGEGAVSVSYAALALARKIFGTLQGRDVLILGAGEMAELTGVHLREHAARRITVASRRLATAAALAERLGGEARPWDQLGEAVRAADIIVSATGASEPVLSRRAVDAAMRSRRGRPLFIFDIGVPRDVEADAGAVDQVFLYNIDDLKAIVEENLAKRAGELAHADRIVSEELDRFAAWMHSRRVVPTVVALRQRFDAIRQAELRRLEPRLAALPPDARARVDEITHLIVEKLLLAPTEQLKAASDDDTLVSYTDAVTRLFELSPESAPGQVPTLRLRARNGAAS
jgi:glutamyl-tRNA reductase